MQKRQVGITLIEIMVVVAIILFIIALLLPIFSSVRAKARQSNCASNLRQIYVAWKIYLEDSNGYPPSLSLLVTKSNAGVFSCPADPWQGFNVGISAMSGHPVSYFYPGFELQDLRKREQLEKADANHGIVFCVLHSAYDYNKIEDRYNRFMNSPLLYANSTFPYPPAFDGILLRLRIDGHVQFAKVFPRCYKLQSGVTLIEIHPWYLLTDSTPCLWCDPNREEVPCTQ